MYNNKYFLKCISNSSVHNDEVYISNKFTGQWFKMPKVCMDVLDHTFNEKMLVGDSINIFEDPDDKVYYVKILENLDKIGLLDQSYIDSSYKGNIEKIQFAITNRCNLKCSFCCMDSNLKDYEDISFDEVKSIIDNIMKFNPSKLVLTGGEPMIRKDFFKILSYIQNNYNTRIQLCTNGTFINEENVDTLISSLYAIDLSLDGYDEESCDKVRGKGTFKKVVNNIRLLKKKGFKNISISMVFGNNNKCEVDKFKQFCKNEGVISVERAFSRVGRGEIDNIYLDNSDDITFYPESLDNCEIIANTCNAGTSQLFVNYEGNIYPCPLLEDSKYLLGSSKEISNEFICKILKRDMDAYCELDKIKTIHYHKCKNCEHNMFCNNCLGLMSNMIKDEKIFNHNCNKIKKIFLNSRLGNK